YSTEPASTIATNPDAICSSVRMLLAGDFDRPDGVEADFAGASMTAPSGEMLSDYVLNPSGSGMFLFPSMPGTGEEPTGAFSYNGSIYLFYTSARPGNDPSASYLAKWVSPDT